jgi:hypothetical protein
LTYSHFDILAKIFTSFKIRFEDFIELLTHIPWLVPPMSKKRKSATHQVAAARKARKLSSAVATALSDDPDYRWENIDFENFLYDVKYPHETESNPLLTFRLGTGIAVTMLVIFLKFVTAELVFKILEDLRNERGDIWRTNATYYIEPTISLIYKVLAISIWIQAVEIPPSGKLGEYSGTARPLRAAMDKAIKHFR